VCVSGASATFFEQFESTTGTSLNVSVAAIPGSAKEPHHQHQQTDFAHYFLQLDRSRW